MFQSYNELLNSDYISRSTITKFVVESCGVLIAFVILVCICLASSVQNKSILDEVHKDIADVSTALNITA